MSAPKFGYLVCLLSALMSSCLRKSSLKSDQRDQIPALPRLIVVIVVDQMRADFLDRFALAFKKTSKSQSPEGFERFRTMGTRFSLARTASAPTVTAAGHATVCSGANSRVHGIVGNSYFERASGGLVDSASDPATQLVRTPGILPNDPLSKWAASGSSNKKMLVPNLADAIVEWSKKTSKVVSISIKDRGAVFCGGSSSAGVYWYDYQSGSMVTSTHYATALPLWVNQFNQNQKPNFNYTWKPLESLKSYKSYLVDSKYSKALEIRSSLSNQFGPGFPYSYSSAEIGALGARKFFEFTPFASEHIVSFALEAQAKERLGCASKQISVPCKMPEKPDLLTISFSTPDLVGHGFGPESLEHFDIYLNLNKSLERLRSELEIRLGAGSVLFVQSSDHGVQTMPEVTFATSGSAVGRISVLTLKSKMEQFLVNQYGQGPWVSALVNGEIYLNQETMKRSAKTTHQVIGSLRDFIKTEKGIKGVASRQEILAGGSEEIDLLKRGHNENRSGDGVLLFEKGWLGDDSIAGNHGTTNEEDTRIPLLFYGWKIPAGLTISSPVMANDIAPTILELIGAPRGRAMTGISRAQALLVNDPAKL
jgi:predicted AlkP superfamily pyrophosphatase or phosphodiesterase